MSLSPLSWTIIATSAAPGQWRFVYGYTSGDAMDRAKSGEWVVMHRRENERWQLLARLSAAPWRKLERWFERNPMRSRV